MGCVENVGFDHWPRQGEAVGRRVKVVFNYDTSRPIMGTVVRDDREAPFESLFQLDDGRVVRSSECQYQPAPGARATSPALVYRLQRERDALLELLVKIKRGEPPEWVGGLIDGYLALGVAVERALAPPAADHEVWLERARRIIAQRGAQRDMEPLEVTLARAMAEAAAGGAP